MESDKKKRETENENDRMNVQCQETDKKVTGQVYH